MSAPTPAAIKQAIAPAQAQGRVWLRARVLRCLTEQRAALSSAEIARALMLPHRPVQRAVYDLLVRGRLVPTGRSADNRPAYRPVEIGTCEWCGLVSHRLVMGECPDCRNRVEHYPSGPADGAPDGSLGAEADVSHAVACMRRLCDED